jgi:benzoyl-CoA reductase/2-hydroxyglutaryl-CoA dehydratase subunit BcrC/BadD/HgdB
MVATILWYEVKAEKKWVYIKQLVDENKEKFEKNQEKAKELYKLFKKWFGESFPESKPIFIFLMKRDLISQN